MAFKLKLWYRETNSICSCGVAGYEGCACAHTWHTGIICLGGPGTPQLVTTQGRKMVWWAYLIQILAWKKLIDWTSQQSIWLTLTGTLQVGILDNHFPQAAPAVLSPITRHYFFLLKMCWLTPWVEKLAVPGTPPGSFCHRIDQTLYKLF